MRCSMIPAQLWNCLGGRPTGSSMSRPSMSGCTNVRPSRPDEPRELTQQVRPPHGVREVVHNPGTLSVGHCQDEAAALDDGMGERSAQEGGGLDVQGC
jgi:hypothetical protein